MKGKTLNSAVVILLLVMQILQLGGNFLYAEAAIKEGDVVHLQADHECDSLLEYWMEDYQKWSYKVVWYVYYIDKEDGNKYPAFCIEPAKEGVGTGYDSYDVTIKNENDNRIWRILNKGYMGSSYQDWNLECDDDFYSATKVALHSLAEGVAPKDKYILGNRSVDGNTIEEIQRRGAKVLEVAQTLYEYGINGTDTYVSPKVSISKQGDKKIENIQNTSYYVQNYKVSGNKSLKSYEVEIQNFPIGTKVLNSQNQEQIKLSDNYFKIVIPINQIKEDIKGNINIKNAYIKTNPIFYCKSSIEKAQSYVTYMSGYEKDTTSTTLNIKANECSLLIQKIDKETKLPIPNVTFKIKDEKGNKITEVTTNENGIAELKNLYPQEILLKEIKVPEPYILSEEEKQVKLEWGKTSNITFENECKKGNLKIIKVDADDNEIPLEGVEFELFDIKGNFIKKLVTDKNGEAFVNDLEIGTYILKETKTKECYYLAKERSVQIKWKETTIEKIENQKQKGQIEVYKVDKEDEKQKLEGVIFEVLDENKKRVETIITNKDGYAITDKLSIGTYYLKEVKTQNKYLLNQDLIEVEVKKEEVTSIKITNEKIKGKIQINKISEDDNKRNGKPKGSPIENVLFEIRKENGEIVQTLTTNEEGIAISKELEKGKYIIKEIKSNIDYEVTEEEFEIEILEHQKIEEITITNISKNPDPPKLPRTGF